MKFKTIAIIAGLSLNIQIQAQTQNNTVDRTVVVEQEYNPEIMDAKKINVLPDIEPLTATPKNVEYDQTVSPGNSFPAEPVAAYPGKEEQQEYKPGYVRLGYGNRGNVDAKLNYLYKPNEDQSINLFASFDGMNGNIKLSDGTKWDHHYYQTKAGADYWQRFARMELKAGGNFGFSNLNLRPDQLLLHKQKYTSGNVFGRLTSTNPQSTIQYDAGANLLFYSRGHYSGNNKSIGETILRTDANVWGTLDENQKIGAFVTMDNRFYGNGFKNNTAITVKPYYTGEIKDWRFHVGINTNMTFGYGRKFRVSPDITAEYVFSGTCILYAKATGGRINNDFRHLELINPYSEITAQAKDGYEQLNISAGAKASPFIGGWFHLYGGYQNLKNDLSYMSEDYIDPVFIQTDASKVYAGLHVTYDFLNTYDLSVKGQYNRWSADDKRVLTVKPEIEFDIRVNARPISGLSVYVDYQYRKMEKPEVAIHSRMKAINNLGLGATYMVYKDISAYTRIANLLNQKYAYYYEYPAQGIHFVLGASYIF
ncbi:MAG: TonB-dependent receptor [Bacteroides sp.]|nr:TonB-dependent receptor [Bacteroides sp.]